jgi:spore coat polysaccharide biosynthesis predicted glycosyltransferase SpsG
MDDAVQPRAHCADIVVNQNLHAQGSFYRDREAHTNLLLGPRFALLRREFRRFAKWRHRIPVQGKRLLVTLGGADPENLTYSLIRALATKTTVDVTVVVGGANPRKDELETEALRAGSHIHVRADVRSMAALMARSDVAISSAGSTVWELAFMGLPAVVGAATSGEELVIEGLKKHDLFYRTGRLAAFRAEEVARTAFELLGDTKRRASMSATGREIVDGQGCDRVLDAMGDLVRGRRSTTKGARG